MLDEIEKAKHTDLSRVLVALSIRHVGPPTAFTLAKHFKTLDALADASAEELEQIDGIGAEIADSIATFFEEARMPGNWRGRVLEAWKAAGVGMSTHDEGLPQTWKARAWWSPAPLSISPANRLRRPSNAVAARPPDR